MSQPEATATNTGPNLPASQTPTAVVLKAAKKARRKIRAKKGEFPAYVPGKSCIQVGKTHNYVDRGKYDECTNCGSSRRHYIPAKPAKKARKAAVIPAAASTPSLPTLKQAIEHAQALQDGVILV